MKNPYITKYGHCFEKRVIERWIIENETCPLTKGPLMLEDVCYYLSFFFFITLILLKDIPLSCFEIDY